MTLAMLTSQAQEIDLQQSVDKWKLYRAVCEARTKLGVTDRCLALLNALLTFHPKDALSAGEGLVVFPSNASLSVRAHGMSETTMRRHLAMLVDAGLIARKDSANGKRFARRDRAGAVDEAYGFSLAPLLARAKDIEILAGEVSAERLRLQRTREKLTIIRRDIGKLIEAALEEGIAGKWDRITEHFRTIVGAIPRNPTLATLLDTLEEFELLRDEIVNLLENQVEAEKTNGNPGQIERHIQNSNSDSISESEPRFETKQDESNEFNQAGTGKTAAEPWHAERRGQSRRPAAKRAEPSSTAGALVRAFPLGMVLRACPQIVDYGPGGQIGSWRDLMVTAVIVRSMLGVSPSAYQEACEILGPENAAAVMACILERGGHINSAGGYLRNLTARAQKGEFGLGPMLMALLRARETELAKAG
jgi:replication initiation protein RepC